MSKIVSDIKFFIKQSKFWSISMTQIAQEDTDHANQGARWEGSNRFHSEDKVVLHLKYNLIVLFLY